MLQRVYRIGMASTILWGAALYFLGMLPVEKSLALAQGAIRVLESGHAVTFGQEMRFSLQVESGSPISSVILAYRTSDTGGTTVEKMDVVPDTSLRLEYVHQMSQRYVRPFVEVAYWWTIVDAAEARLVTEPRHFVYADDRYDWQTLTGDAASVHWYEGDLKVAQQALDVIGEGLARARPDIAPDASVGHIEAYLYAGKEDLATALPPGSPADVEAITLNGMNVILAAIPPHEAFIPDLRRVLSHEATHVLIHETAQGAHDRVPLWLSEGLSTSVQYGLLPDPLAETVLEDAVRRDALIPLLHLCAAFPEDATAARLAYAESANVIGYIRDQHGRQAVRDLVAAYADGATCEGGVYRVLGITLDGLDAQWRESLAPQARGAIFWRVNGPWIILLLLSMLFPLAFVLPRPGRKTALEDKGL
jgi:hypothetical protein